MPITSFYSDLTQRLRKDLQAEKAAVEEKILAGVLTYEQYKSETGKRNGLIMAEAAIDKALADTQKG